ncbi:hypothetical protein MPER_12065 [Moniliophthora perniciosa FA553]|nr:hypothetical protein MPER_12065 [Moniliophthora perniciosa FA553]
MWDSKDPTWGETVGFTPLILANSASTGDMDESPVGAPTPANPLRFCSTGLATLLVSIPFLTLIFRLLLVGYWEDKSHQHWHLSTRAHYYLAGAIAVWLWTFAVARGILRVVVSGVIGGWYIQDPPIPLPPLPSLTTITAMHSHSRAADTRTFHAALTRAYGPSLGTISLSALILTLVRLLVLVALFLDRLPGWIDAGVAFLRRSVLGPVFGMGVALLYALGTYIFVSHTLGAPDEAFGAAVLAGGVTSLTAGFVVGLVGDMADAVWLCFVGFGEKRDEIREAFEREGLGRRRRPAQQQQQQHQPPASTEALVRSQPLQRDEIDDDVPPEDILFDAAGQVEAGGSSRQEEADDSGLNPFLMGGDSERVDPFVGGDAGIDRSR